MRPVGQDNPRQQIAPDPREEPTRQLWWALNPESKDPSKVRYALDAIEEGAHLNSMNEHGQTPLHLAASSPVFALVVRDLIKAKARLVLDRFGLSPLYYACTAPKDNLKNIEKILGHWSFTDKMINAADPETGETALSHVTRIKDRSLGNAAMFLMMRGADSRLLKPAELDLLVSRLEESATPSCFYTCLEILAFQKTVTIEEDGSARTLNSPQGIPLNEAMHANLRNARSVIIAAECGLADARSIDEPLIDFLRSRELPSVGTECASGLYIATVASLIRQNPSLATNILLNEVLEDCQPKVVNTVGFSALMSCSIGRLYNTLTGSSPTPINLVELVALRLISCNQGIAQFYLSMSEKYGLIKSGVSSDSVQNRACEILHHMEEEAREGLPNAEGRGAAIGEWLASVEAPRIDDLVEPSAVRTVAPSPTPKRAEVRSASGHVGPKTGYPEAGR